MFIFNKIKYSFNCVENNENQNYMDILKNKYNKNI